MKTLRWIFGFPLAFVISVGFIFIASIGISLVRFRFFWSSGTMFYLLVYVMAYVFSTALWVVLTCIFIPSNKKLAGLIPVIIGGSLAIASVVYTVVRFENLRRLYDKTTFYFALIISIGLILGYGISYILFKDKGGRRLKNDRSKQDLAEIYAEQLAADNAG